MQQLDYLRRLWRIANDSDTYLGKLISVADASGNNKEVLSAFIDKVEDGGPGSGNWGHRGRSGYRGGSARKGQGSGGSHYRGGSAQIGYFSSKKDWVNGLTGQKNAKANKLVKHFAPSSSSNPTSKANEKVAQLLTKKGADPSDYTKACQYLQLMQDARNWQKRWENLTDENLTDEQAKVMDALLGKAKPQHKASKDIYQMEQDLSENASEDQWRLYQGIKLKAMEASKDVPEVPESVKRLMKGMRDYSHQFGAAKVQSMLDVLKQIGVKISNQDQDDFDTGLVNQQLFQKVEGQAMPIAMSTREKAKKFFDSYLNEKVKATGYQQNFSAGDSNPFGFLSSEQDDKLYDLIIQASADLAAHDDARIYDIGKIGDYLIKTRSAQDVQSFLSLLNKSMGGPSGQVTGKFENGAKHFRKQVPSGMRDFTKYTAFANDHNRKRLSDLAWMDSGIQKRMHEGKATVQDWHKLQSAALRNAFMQGWRTQKYVNYLQTKAKVSGYIDNYKRGDVDPYNLLSAQDKETLQRVQRAYPDMQNIPAASAAAKWQALSLLTQAMGGPKVDKEDVAFQQWRYMTADRKKEATKRAMELRAKRQQPQMQLFQKSVSIGDSKQQASLANPHYADSSKSRDKKYTQNCQRCVTAFICRLLGYDVQARPTYKGDTMPLQTEWPKVFRNTDRTYIRSARRTKTRENVEKHILSQPDGAINIISLQWTSTTGHVIIGRNVGGKVQFIDPQNPERDCYRQLEIARPGSVGVLRVDNNPFTDNVKRAVRARGGSYDDR